MAKFVGNVVISLFFVVASLMILRSLPDLARYLKIREM
jgi:hypothetical protein